MLPIPNVIEDELVKFNEHVINLQDLGLEL
jgi:hypothetical protein